MSRFHILFGLPIPFLICWLCNSDASLSVLTPIVQLSNGTLEGTFMKSRNGRTFAAFRGIPYAQPPVGSLRFAPPKPADAWTGIRSAKSDGHVCPQRNFVPNSDAVTGNEDCLYLNIYSPRMLRDGEEDTRYPVMIWIHGGSCTHGSGHSTFYPPTFLLDHDIVLVTINYRIGTLGFLSTEDLSLPGNQGLKDQAQAIKWVHENIAAFGGDLNRVTLFGGSAGGAMVHYHMISPLTRGLFQRAISQSGTIHCPWALFEPGVARDRAYRFGKHLNCSTKNSEVLVDCLRTKDANDLVVNDDIFQAFGICPIPASRAVIEPDHPGAFLAKDPAEVLKSGNVMDVPWITGVNSHEGSLNVAGLYESENEGLPENLDDNFMDLAPITFLYESACPKKLRDNVTKSIRKFYLGDKKIDESTRMSVIDMYTDRWFLSGTDKSVRARLETLGSPVYYYFFAYKGSFSNSVGFGETDNDYGVGHGDELQYFFPRNESVVLGTDLPYEKEDYEMIDLMTTMWTNFAKLGDPTPETTQKMPTKWKPVRTSRLEYLHIGGSQDLRMMADIFPERIKIWSSIPRCRVDTKGSDDATHTRDEL